MILPSLLLSFSFWVLILTLRILVFFTIFLACKLSMLLQVCLCIKLSMPLICWPSLLWQIVSLVRTITLQISILCPMTILSYLIPLLIEALLVPFNISPLLGLTCPLLFSRLVSLWVILLKITCQLLSAFGDTLGVLFTMVLLLPLVFHLCLQIVMLTRQVIQLIVSPLLALFCSLVIVL